MRNMLALLALAVLTFGGLGWYLDWYKVQSSPVTEGRQSVNIDINRDKIISDVHKGLQQLEERTQGVATKTAEPTAGKVEKVVSEVSKQLPNQ